MSLDHCINSQQFSVSTVTPTNGFPDSTVIEPRGRHFHTVILLHGRGSSGKEFSDELFESQGSAGKTLPELLPNYRWVFPSARILYAKTIQENMSQWYDMQPLSSPGVDHELQLDELRASVAHLKDIVGMEQAMAPTGKVLLGGISQGFSVAMILALVDCSQMHCLLGFSSWLPMNVWIQTKITHRLTDRQVRRERLSLYLSQALDLNISKVAEAMAPPIFLAHCADDHIVDIGLGRELMQTSIDLGFPVNWNESADGGPWINEPEGIDAIFGFLSRFNLTDAL